MKKNQLELIVCINGKPVREYVKDGRVYVEAKSGSSYSLKVKNNTWGRILAVFSVDGIDVLKGKSAAEADSGYVIAAQNNVEIKGFRVDNDKEASFKFFEKGNGNGYAEIKGDASSTGVIGVRIYSEKIVLPTVKEYVPVYIDRPVPVYPRPYWYDMTYRGDMSSTVCDSTETYVDTLNCFNSKVPVSDCADSETLTQTKSSILRARGTESSTQPSSRRFMRMQSDSQVEEKTRRFDDMTTGWGQAVESKVTVVTFDRGELVSQMEILYASRESLTQMGIKFDSLPEVAIPSAFNSSLNFCSPPVGWKG